MSTQPPQAPAAIVNPESKEIRIVSHSNLFYWWPVWAVGLIIATLSYFSGHLMAVVPKETKAEKGIINGKEEGVLVIPGGAVPETPRFKVSHHKSYGVIYVVVLLLVIVITNVPLRGMWSVVVIMAIIFLSIIFTTLNWWDPILESLGQLHIYINTAGYFVLSLSLLVIWLLALFFFDRQTVWVFTPKQLKVHHAIGSGEEAYDTTNISVKKLRSDLFRHWVLGLGSGDLVVKTSGADPQHIEIQNVLFINYKVRQIDDLIREVQQA